MSFKKAIVSTAAAAALATSAFAGWSGMDISKAADQTGDYLLFTNYYATTADWQTNLRVVNTNTTASVIAKVVIRDARQSNEKVDFLIYLSPGDVWDGNIDENGGTVTISSADDSMILGDVLGSESAHTISFPAAENGEVITSGYVEVFGVAKTSQDHADFGVVGAACQGVNLGDAPVNKHCLYDAYLNDSNGDTSPIEGNVAVNWVPVGNDDLTGQAVVSASNANGNLAMTYVASAFEDAMGTAALSSSVVLGQDTKIATHIMTAGQAAFASVADWILEMETAVTKSGVYAIHYGDADIDESAVTATFFTKKYRLDEAEGTAADIDLIFAAKPETGWPVEYAYSESSDYYINHAATPRDMEENKPGVTTETDEVSGDTPPEEVPVICDYELCTLAVTNSMGTNGYVTYDFDGEAEDNATAVENMPFEAKLLTAKNVGGANVTNMIQPADYK